MQKGVFNPITNKEQVEAELETTNFGQASDTAKTDSTQSGSLIAFIKGLVKILTDVWSSANHWLNVNIAPLSKTIDSIATYSAGEGIIVSGVLYTVKSAIANIAASQTDANVITAVTSKKLRVVGLVSQAGITATNLTFNSKGAGAGTAISPTFQNGINGGEVLPKFPSGWFETNAGEALTVTTGSGSTTGILVKYIEIP